MAVPVSEDALKRQAVYIIGFRSRPEGAGNEGIEPDVMGHSLGGGLVLLRIGKSDQSVDHYTFVVHRNSLNTEAWWHLCRVHTGMKSCWGSWHVLLVSSRCFEVASGGH